jgi:hypothetical protein
MGAVKQLGRAHVAQRPEDGCDKPSTNPSRRRPHTSVAGGLGGGRAQPAGGKQAVWRPGAPRQAGVVPAQARPLAGGPGLRCKLHLPALGQRMGAHARGHGGTRPTPQALLRQSGRWDTCGRAPRRHQALLPKASLAQDVRGSWSVAADEFKGVTTLRRRARRGGRDRAASAARPALCLLFRAPATRCRSPPTKATLHHSVQRPKQTHTLPPEAGRPWTTFADADAPPPPPHTPACCTRATRFTSTPAPSRGAASTPATACATTTSRSCCEAPLGVM